MNTPMIKRFLLLALAAFVLTGCSAVPPATDSSSQKSTTTQQQSADTKSATDTETADDATQPVQTLSDLATIGDTPARWEKQLGHPYAQGDTIKVYQNGAYKVVFEKGKAVTITFVSKDGKNPVVASMLPEDGEKLSESSKQTGGLTMIVQKYHSKALAKAFPETDGNYTLMKNMNGKTFDSVVVDCTPNLTK